MSKFKVGDIVEYVGVMSGRLYGKVGRLMEFGYDGRVGVLFEGESVVLGVLPKNLIPAQRKCTLDKNKLLIGDKVILKNGEMFRFETKVFVTRYLDKNVTNHVKVLTSCKTGEFINIDSFNDDLSYNGDRREFDVDRMVE